MKRMEGLTYSLSYEDVIEILRIVDDTLEGLELSLEIGDFKLTVKKSAPGTARVQREPETRAPVQTAAADVVPNTPTVTTQKSAPPSATPSLSPNAVTVKAPMVGTFYRAPAPGASSFVELGSHVGPDDIIGIIEVMKLMNEIRAGHRGRVTAILAEDGKLVEYGQPLVVIEPGA